MSRILIGVALAVLGLLALFLHGASNDTAVAVNTATRSLGSLTVTREVLVENKGSTTLAIQASGRDYLVAPGQTLSLSPTPAPGEMVTVRFVFMGFPVPHMIVGVR